ncbi:hypothetical protein PF008_g22544 [Phytophthora fragariae]|uniref:RxLR effector protein n=1 Tax=Phytophthora fragariae TaxID=53985 RepID=A0A6G0QTL5_9STRA|nr:hypothetical protein PF008_g22544 [Phytophthora fragariae]
MKVSYAVLVVTAALLAALPESSSSRSEVRQQVATTEMGVQLVHLRRALHETTSIVDASDEEEESDDSEAEEEEELNEQAEEEDENENDDADAPTNPPESSD